MLITTQGTKIHIYKCSRCGKLFSAQVGRVTVSCCVDHGGGCCHYMETEISEQSLENIISIIKGNPTMRATDPPSALGSSATGTTYNPSTTTIINNSAGG